jgi:hypothetical protein
MKKTSWVVALVSVVVALASAQAGSAAKDPFDSGTTRLVGFQEVPTILTAGQGRFFFRIRMNRVEWQLSYGTLDGTVTQAHIHLGQADVNGGIAVFLCSNLGNGPAGTQACPAAPATIGGTFASADVLAIAAQGLPAGDFARLVTALRAGVTYANVHSTLYPGGEVRGQLTDPHTH